MRQTDRQRKVLTSTKRFLSAEIKAIDDEKFPNGGFVATLSMPTLDRDHEIIDGGAFKPLPKSIPIFSDHFASVETTVARARPYYEGDTLKAEGWFDEDEHSQLVRNKVKNGFVPSMSVGYMSPVVECDDNGVWHTKSAELLEASFTPLPSNREAMVMEAKAHKAGRRNSSKDQQNIQDAHDSLVAAGATCAEEPDADDNPKSLDEMQITLYRLLSVAEKADSEDVRAMALEAAHRIAGQAAS